MARNNRRQFVWARSYGVVSAGGGGGQQPADDLLAQVRDRYGEGVLRGATVMGIKGYIRPNIGPGFEGSPYMLCRSAIRVASSPVITQGDESNEWDPFADPDADWMMFNQALIVPTQSIGMATDNVRGNLWGVETRAARKFEELGQTLALFGGARNADTQSADPERRTFFDYDLSIGLKLP